MKQFLIHFFSILALVFFLLFACDIVYTKIYQDAAPRNKLQYIMGLKNENFDVVFLGSSRVENNIDTRLFHQLSHKKAYNLGVASSGLNDNFLQLKLLLDKCRVKNVILQLDFNLETINPTHISLAETMPFIDNPIIKEHSRKYNVNFASLYYIPFYRYAINEPKLGLRELFFSFLNKKPKINPSIGYNPKFGTNKNLQVRENILREKILLQNNAMYDEIKLLCRQKNIKLIVFVAPFCSKMEIGSYIKKIKKIAPNLIDLTKGYPDSMFFDCEHLNNIGSEKLTESLYEATKEQCNFE